MGIDIDAADIPDLDKFEEVGIKTKLHVRCHYMIDEIEIDGKLASMAVEDRPGGDGKTYVIVFDGGGTCEFDITSRGKMLELMDSHGIDFSWAGNGTMNLRPHRPTTAPGSRSLWGRRDIELEESELIGGENRPAPTRQVDDVR